MLNAKALSALLSENRDDRLCKRWYLMTPNGTLLAYSQPSDINDLRRQAALAALSWQESARQTDGLPVDGPARAPDQTSALHLLAIESESSNLLIQRLQRQLLLVLEGGVPPRRSNFERRVTAEAENGDPISISPHQPDAGLVSELGTSASSTAESGAGGVASGVLRVQRKKMEALAGAIVAEFEQTGFQMPEEGSATFF